MKLWKHWTISGLAWIVGALIVFVGQVAPAHESLLGPGVVRLLNLPDGPLACWYACMLLTVSGQLCFLIGWRRSCSLTDFSGRYRIWYQAAWIWLFVAFCVFTEAHLLLAETVVWRSGWTVRGFETWSWLIPAGMGGLALFRALRREMIDCLSSRTLIELAGLAYLIAGVVEAAVISRDPLWTSGAFLFGHVCLMASLLLHARYVIHVSAEPPTPTVALWRSFGSRAQRLCSWCGRQMERFRNIRKFDRHRQADKSERFQTGDSSIDTRLRGEGKSRSTSRKTTTKKGATANAAPNETGEVSQPEDQDPVRNALEREDGRPTTKGASTAKQRAGKSSIEQPESAPAVTIPDGADPEKMDKELLKGLSKRERRKLRQQWREAARQTDRTVN